MRRSRLPALISSTLLLPAAGAQVPKPAIQDATEAVRDATPLNTNLAPAPTVTRWGPVGGNVDHGLVTIEGQAFDPATIRVTFRGTALTLVEKSSTKVVARLGDLSAGSYFEGPLAIGNVGGQGRVLAEKYQILPRWPSTPPRFVEARRLTNPVWRPGLVPFSGTSDAEYQARFLGVPGDEIVGERLNNPESANGYCISASYGSWQVPSQSAPDGKVTSSNPQPNYPVPIEDDPATFESGRRGSQELHLQRIRLTTSLLNGGANSNGRLIVKVRYRDEPDDVREITLPMPGLASPAARRVLVVSATQEFMDSKLVRVEGSTRNTPKVCARESYEGDYRQSLTNLPGVGSDCQFKFTYDDAYWRENFKVMAWNWSGPTPPAEGASSRPRCYVASRDFPRLDGTTAYAAGQMGWKRFDEGYVPVVAIRNVRMECRGEQDSPTVVRSRLNSVEIFAPATAVSWRDAIK
jgi:hypothetical protein